jgi:hypothetical protein
MSSLQDVLHRLVDLAAGEGNDGGLHAAIDALGCPAPEAPAAAPGGPDAGAGDDGGPVPAPAGPEAPGDAQAFGSETSPEASQ